MIFKKAKLYNGDYLNLCNPKCILNIFEDKAWQFGKKE